MCGISGRSGIMASNASSGLLGNQHEKTVKTSNLTVEGHLLRWSDTVLQISNISLITSGNMEAPAFPTMGLVFVLAGLLGLSAGSAIALIGLVALCVGGFLFYRWYVAWQKSKECKYLHILLNCGYTYSILFENEGFLQQVLEVFANIFKDGGEAGTNYFIDISNSRIGNVVQN